MSKTYIKTVVITVLFFVINCILSCTPYSWNGYNNKEEVINDVKNNIDDLNSLVKELIEYYKDESKFNILENTMFAVHKRYCSSITNRLYNKLKLDEIRIYKYKKDTKKGIESDYGKDETKEYEDLRIQFYIKHKFGGDCGFYYSLNDDKNYHRNYRSGVSKKIFQQYCSYFELGDKTIYLYQHKTGWYTEKICNNWYFYEEDCDYLNFMKYIYDDFMRISTVSEYHQKYRSSFEKYNPHLINSK